MRPYKFNIPAGQTNDASIGPVNYMRLDKSATVNVAVEDLEGGGQSYVLEPGDDVRWGQDVYRVRISHDGASTAAFTLWASQGGRAGSAQVSGAIQPIGGSDNAANPPLVQFPGSQLVTPDNIAQAAIDAEQGFIAGFYLNTAAGQYALVQLLNPAGSGKTVYVDAVVMDLVTADSVLLIRVGSAGIGTQDTTNIVNKVLGGTAPTAQLWKSALTTPTAGSILIQSKNGGRVEFEKPLRLDPGESLGVRSYSVNIDIMGMFEGYEV